MTVEEPFPRPKPAEHQEVPDYDEDLGDGEEEEQGDDRDEISGE